MASDWLIIRIGAWIIKHIYWILLVNFSQIKQFTKRKIFSGFNLTLTKYQNHSLESPIPLLPTHTHTHTHPHTHAHIYIYTTPASQKYIILGNFKKNILQTSVVLHTFRLSCNAMGIHSCSLLSWGNFQWAVCLLNGLPLTASTCLHSLILIAPKHLKASLQLSLRFLLTFH